MWEDTDGAAHYDIPKLLELFEFQDTPENRELVTNTIAELIQEKLPNVTIVVRARTPEADT